MGSEVYIQPYLIDNSFMIHYFGLNYKVIYFMKTRIRGTY
jgi:hypothetical protein